MHFNYKPHNVCSTKIEFDLNEGYISNVRYENGCNGNLKAIGLLVDGMKATEVINKLRGVRCGYKDTSCSDQLARAIEKAISEK